MYIIKTNNWVILKMLFISNFKTILGLMQKEFKVCISFRVIMSLGLLKYSGIAYIAGVLQQMDAGSLGKHRLFAGPDRYKPGRTGQGCEDWNQ